MKNAKKKLDTLKEAAIKKVATMTADLLRIHASRKNRFIVEASKADFNSKRFFENWGKSHYSLGRLTQHSDLMEYMQKTMNFCDQDIILDIGCGTGKALNFIPSAQEVTLLDASHPFLLQAAQAGKNKPYLCRTVFADMTSYFRRIPKTYHKMIGIMALHHIPHAQKLSVMKGIARGLRKDGKLFIGETFFDTTRVDTPAGIKAASNWYWRKIQNCIVQECVEHGLREIVILRRILFKKGEYMCSLIQWKKLLKKAGLKITQSKIIDSSIAYGFIAAEKM